MKGKRIILRKKGRESEDFRKGNQWDDEVKRKLESNDRAALTINEIGKNMDELFGYQAEQETDIHYLPVGEGDQRVADVLNVVTKVVLNNCNYAREEKKIFRDQCTPGRGIIHTYMSFDRDIEGDVMVEHFPWDDICYGPHEKEDLSDCEYEVRSKMYSKAKLKQLHPKKADEIENNFNDYLDIEKKVTEGTNQDYNEAKRIESPLTIDGVTPLIDIAQIS